MDIKQATKADWNEVCHPLYLCTLNLYPLDVTDKLGVEFFEFVEDGLGWLCASVIIINGIYYWLFASFDPENRKKHIKDDPEAFDPNKEAYKVSVNIRSYEKNAEIALLNICKAFNITISELYENNKSLGEATWQLTRLDDNGNEFEMFRFHEEGCAKFVQNKYEEKGHKQAYFVKQFTPDRKCK